jgi:hypothetical protein
MPRSAARKSCFAKRSIVIGGPAACVREALALPTARASRRVGFAAVGCYVRAASMRLSHRAGRWRTAQANDPQELNARRAKRKPRLCRRFERRSPGRSAMTASGPCPLPRDDHARDSGANAVGNRLNSSRWQNRLRWRMTGREFERSAVD